jgi:hypothetical protein
MYNYGNSLRSTFSKDGLFNANGVGVIPRKGSENGIPAGVYHCGVYLKLADGTEKWLLSNEEIVIENW